MFRIRKQIDHSDERKDLLTTLAIAALLHETDEAVKECALRLSKRASERMARDYLVPLANSRNPLGIIFDEVINPTDNMVLGEVYFSNYLYELILKWTGVLDFTVEDIVGMVSAKFLQRGILTGRIQISFIHPHYRGMYTTSVLMDDYVKRCAAVVDYAA